MSHLRRQQFLPFQPVHLGICGLKLARWLAVSVEGPALRVVAASNAPAATNEARLENDGSYMSGIEKNWSTCRQRRVSPLQGRCFSNLNSNLMTIVSNRPLQPGFHDKSASKHGGTLQDPRLLIPPIDIIRPCQIMPNRGLKNYFAPKHLCLSGSMFMLVGWAKNMSYILFSGPAVLHHWPGISSCLRLRRSPPHQIRPLKLGLP